MDDLSELPVSYGEFQRATSTDLSHGTLEGVCTGQTPDQDALFQVLRVTTRKSGSYAIVTDGATQAVVYFDNGQASLAEVPSNGSVVRLINLQCRGQELACSTVITHLDADQELIPALDTGNMKQSKPRVTSSSAAPTKPVVLSSEPLASADSVLPPAFLAFQRKRKADEDTDPPPKHTPVDRIGSPPARDDPVFPRHTLMDMQKIDESSSKFSIGPVCIAEWQVPAENTRRPTKLLLVDAKNTRMFFASFAVSAAVHGAFGPDWKQKAFFLAGGQVQQSKGSNAPHVCEVLFGLVGDGSARSRNDCLAIVTATDHEYRWVLQCARDRGDPLSHDPHHRSTQIELSVPDAVDATQGDKKLRGAVVRGIVNAVQHRTTQAGNPFISVTLVGRESADSAERIVKFNVFSSSTLAMGAFIDLFGSESYDRQLSSRGDMCVRMQGIEITPHTSYPYNVERTCEVTQVDVPSDQQTLCQVRPYSELPVHTLAEALAAPEYQRFTAYIAVGHMTEVRPRKTMYGTSESRWVSYMDDSKRSDGMCVSESALAFKDSPLVKALQAVGHQEAAPYAEHPDKVGGHVRVRPADVVIAKVINATVGSSQPKEGSSWTPRKYISFDRDTKIVVVYPTDGDARAEALRTWFTNSGHMQLIERAHPDENILERDSDYRSFYEHRVPSSSSVASSSDAGACARRDNALTDLL